MRWAGIKLDDVTVVSDRGKAVLAAVHSQQGAESFHCAVHLQRNLETHKHARLSTAQVAVFYNMVQAIPYDEFIKAKEQLKALLPNQATYIDTFESARINVGRFHAAHKRPVSFVNSNPAEAEHWRNMDARYSTNPLDALEQLMLKWSSTMADHMRLLDKVLSTFPPPAVLPAVLAMAEPERHLPGWTYEDLITEQGQVTVVRVRTSQLPCVHYEVNLPEQSCTCMRFAEQYYACWHFVGAVAYLRRGGDVRDRLLTKPIFWVENLQQGYARPILFPSLTLVEADPETRVESAAHFQLQANKGVGRPRSNPRVGTFIEGRHKRGKRS